MSAEPSSNARAAESCASVQLKGNRCSELNISIDLSKCGEKKAIQRAKVSCKGSRAEARVTTENGVYRTELSSEQVWGQNTWSVGPVSFEKSKKKLKSPSGSDTHLSESDPRLSALPKLLSKNKTKNTDAILPEPNRGPASVITAPPSGPSAVRDSQEQSPIPPSPQEEETRLTKNWGGARKKLSELGVDLALLYKGNWVGNWSGGLEKKNTHLGNIDFRTSLDAEKLIHWKGATFFMYVLSDYGGDPSRFVGDLQVTNNTETAADYSTKLYELWYQQLFHEERISLLLGIHDFNSEFYVTESAGLFLNSSFGVGKELSQTGYNGPSIFPNTSPAARIRVEPSKDYYLQWGAFEQKSGDFNDPRGTHINFNAKDGWLMASEFARLRGKVDTQQLPAKYALGVWTYTLPFDHLVDKTSDGKPVKDISAGAYLMADQNITDQIAVFMRYGIAASTVNRVASCWSAGVLVTGPIPGRTKDRLGLGFTQAKNGPEYLQNQKDAGILTTDSEKAIELTYRFELIPGIAVQPDFQYVLDPNTNPSIPAATVATLRLELNF